MRNTILILAVSFGLLLSACEKNSEQEPAGIPSSGMYLSPQFSDAELKFTRNLVFTTRANLRNIQYTSIRTKAAELNSATLDCRMDIVVPPNATPSSRQPLIVFIHGGGFVTGDKDDMADQALTYARSGYVVASINYRLTQNQTNDTLRLVSRIHALEDVGNAIRFLKVNRDKYGIDTSRVLTIGSSAGGGLSLVNAIEPDASTSVSDHLGFSTRVNGAVSTGATLSLEDLSGVTLRYDASDSPVLMFHADPLDGGTGATWQDVLDTQQRIVASGNSCLVHPQPNLTHTVSLELGGTYWPQLKPFIWEKLRLAEKR